MSESLKNLLNSKNENSQVLQKIIRENIAKIEKDLGYSEHEQVNIDFLLTMLSNGSIDEDYRYFTSKSYEGFLSLFDRDFLNILKCELNPDYKLHLDNVENVVDEIRDFQWSNPSVLNNDILTYLITNQKVEELQGFLIAVLNHYNDHKKNDFINQYIESIKNSKSQENAIKALSQEMQKKISMNMLTAFFGNDLSDLFFRFFGNFTKDQLKKNNEAIKEFLENRKKILDYVLKKVILEKNKSLEDLLVDINFEIDNLADYNGPIEKFLETRALFKVSRENLDFILSNQGKVRPYFYYDYIRENINIKSKIINSYKINAFIREFILNDEKMNVSTEGTVELIFSNYVLLDTKEIIIKKIDNEKIDLAVLPIVFRDTLNSVLNKSIDLIHSLIQNKKIRKDFNNVLYIFKMGSEEDFVKFINDNKDQIVSKIKGKDELRNDLLKEFYSSFLRNKKINQDSFYEISKSLVREDIDILNYVDFNTSVPNERIDSLTKICFLRNNINIEGESNDVFMDLIRINFDFFLTNFFDIKWMCDKSWEMNMSILLRNKRKNPVGGGKFDDVQLGLLMNFISPYNFSNIMKCWIDRIGVYEISNIVDNLLNRKCLDVWLNHFGIVQILDVCNKYDGYILSDVRKRIEDYCGGKDNPVFEIAAKYNIQKEAVADKDYRAYYLLSQDIIGALKTHNWNKQNPVAYAFKERIKKELLMLAAPTNGLINDLFVIGRNLCQAAEAAHSVNSLVRELDDVTICPKGTEKFNPILSGVAFEIYFDREGSLRKKFKDACFEDVLNQLEKYSDGTKFIAECLKMYIGRFVFVPGDADVVFKVLGNVENQEIEIHSLKCFDIEILSKQDSFMYENEGCSIPWTGFVDRLKYSLGKIFAIPQKHVKLDLPNQNVATYKLTPEKNGSKPLHEIALPVNYKKRVS